MSSSIYYTTARFSFTFQKTGGGRAKIPLKSDRSNCSEKAWYFCCFSICNIPPILGIDLMDKRAQLLLLGTLVISHLLPGKRPNQVGARGRTRKSEYGGETGSANGKGGERRQERGQPLRLCRLPGEGDHEGESRIPQFFSPEVAGTTLWTGLWGGDKAYRHWICDRDTAT